MGCFQWNIVIAWHISCCWICFSFHVDPAQVGLPEERLQAADWLFTWLGGGVRIFSCKKYDVEKETLGQVGHLVRHFWLPPLSCTQVPAIHNVYGWFCKGLCTRLIGLGIWTLILVPNGGKPGHSYRQLLPLVRWKSPQASWGAPPLPAASAPLRSALPLSLSHPPSTLPFPWVKNEQRAVHPVFVRVARSPSRHDDLLSPWQPAPSCLHSIYSSSVPAPLPAVRVPTYFLSIACGEPRDEKASACVLNRCWLMKHI